MLTEIVFLRRSVAVCLPAAVSSFLWSRSRPPQPSHPDFDRLPSGGTPPITLPFGGLRGDALQSAACGSYPHVRWNMATMTGITGAKIAIELVAKS